MSNSITQESPQVAYIVQMIYCDEYKNRLKYSTTFAQKTCGIADSLKSAESLMEDYHENYEIGKVFGYRIEERFLNKATPSEERTFDYDNHGEKLQEIDFSIGDPVDVFYNGKVALGVITNITADEKGHKFSIATSQTHPSSFYCGIGSIRRPHYLITEHEMYETQLTSDIGIAWQKCQEANISKAQDILNSFAEKLGKGITITSNDAYSPETTFTITVQNFPKPDWKAQINIRTDKIILNQRKAYVTLRTILRLPTNGKRYPYKKAVLSYKSEIHYNI